MFKSLIIIDKPINKFNIMPHRARCKGVFARIKKWAASPADYGENTTKSPDAETGTKVD
jgi:hypothetical protein